MTIYQYVGLALLAWLAIGACALLFVGHFFHLAEKDDEE